MLRRRGYHLDPHLDPRRVVFTTLIYFARPGESEAYGTAFYRMSAMPNIDRTSTFYPESQGIRCRRHSPAAYFFAGTVQRNTHRPSTSTRWSAVHPSMS
jgi:hypothetical protein